MTDSEAIRNAIHEAKRANDAISAEMVHASAMLAQAWVLIAREIREGRHG